MMICPSFRTPTRRVLLCTAAAALALVTTGAAAQQDYPGNKPIRMIVPFAPGGSTDLVARTIANKLGEAWNVPVVVTNMPGAGGRIGAQYVARAAPDGYTIMLGTQSSQVLEPLMHQPAAFDPIKDFTPISRAVVISLLLAAHPSVPARNMQELIALAKAQPGTLNFGSSGTGTSSHLAGELLKRTARIDVVHIPYNGGGPAVAALLANNVQLEFGSGSTAWPYVKAGKLVALGSTGLQRSAAFPDVPTIGEQVPGYSFIQWLGVLGPARLPAPVLAKLNSAIVKILQAPDVVESFTSQSLEPAGNTPQAFAAFLQGELTTYAKIIKEANIHPD